MRRLTKKYLALLLPVIWQAAVPCQAAPVVKTTPRSIPLHFISDLPNGPIIPRVALKAEFVAYPKTPSYKEFLDAPKDSPELAVARYVQVLSANRDTLTPEALGAAKAFFAPDETKESEDIVTKVINKQYSDIKRNADIRMWDRYDGGGLSIITLATPSKIGPNGFLPFVTLYLRKIGSSYFPTSYGTSYREENSGLDTLIDLSDGLLLFNPNLADVPQPNYPFHFQFHILPGATDAPNPLEVAFTGKVSNILVDENMVPADPVQAFIKRAFQVERTGTLKQFLSLWTDTDRKDFVQEAEPGDDQLPLSSLAFVAEGIPVRLVFTLDYEVGSVVFFQPINSKDVQPAKEQDYFKKLWLLVVWKQGPNDYRLSQSSGLDNGETTLIFNLEKFFYTPEFQAYLKDQVDQFTQENGKKTNNTNPHQ